MAVNEFIHFQNNELLPFSLINFYFILSHSQHNFFENTNRSEVKSGDK
jgi:hypothetical protein